MQGGWLPLYLYIYIYIYIFVGGGVGGRCLGSRAIYVVYSSAIILGLHLGNDREETGNCSGTWG